MFRSVKMTCCGLNLDLYYLYSRSCRHYKEVGRIIDSSLSLIKLSNKSALAIQQKARRNASFFYVRD